MVVRDANDSRNVLDFRIADTFTDSLARLTGDEQKAVKTTAFGLRLNQANPGMSFHMREKAKDKNFWSVRVGNDIRLIVLRATRASCSATSRKVSEARVSQSGEKGAQE